jgi:hypothetical protein
MEEETFEPLEEEQAEEITSEESVEEDVNSEENVSHETQSEDVVQLKARLEELEKTNKQLYARTKKERPAIKSDNIELIEFFAQGNTRDDYERLQVIMKGTGQSLSEAQKDPMYQSYQEKVVKERRDEKAQLGGSKAGSPPEQVFKPNMTEAEHKEAWKKTQS